MQTYRSQPTYRLAPSQSSAQLNGLMAASTMAILGGVAAAQAFASSADSVDAIFARPAPALGIGLLIAFLIEMRAGVRNLVRADIFMLLVLYVLLFAEFLFPQDTLVGRVTPEGAAQAVNASLIAFAAIAVGRHVVPRRPTLPRVSAGAEIPTGLMLFLFFSCFGLGFLNVLASVNFDFFEAIEQMNRPRFSQPWTRGRFGDLDALLAELMLLTYLIPPLSAAILAERRRYNPLVLLAVLLCFLFTVYFGFSSGTRNIIITHLVTFIAAYAVVHRDMTLMRLLGVAGPAVALGVFAIVFLPEIRTVGLGQFELEESRTDGVFVDMSLVNLAGLTDRFPADFDFLGLEIPYAALIRPIPRAFWPDKPEGLSVSIESALGVDSLTLSATFVGEMWMAGGTLAVALGAFLYGAAAAAWNRVGAAATTSLAFILFASGFFAAGLGMRSFLQLAPAVLPTIALAIFIAIFANRRQGARR
jgi:hypothetical protein